MTDDQKSRITPPPSVDDVLSSLMAESRIGQVDFSAALAPDPASPSAKDDIGANLPDNVRARYAADRRAAHISSSETAPPVEQAEPVVEEPTVVEPVVEEPTVAVPVVDEEPTVQELVVQAPKPAKARKPRLPKAKPAPVAEPVIEPVIDPDIEPATEPVIAPATERIVVEPTPPAPEPTPPAVVAAVEVARAVEEIAENVIARMHAAEEATLRHLDAMQMEATRRYELVTAQAELDAELIRLQSRREAHAIITAARMRAGEVDDLHDDPDDTGHRLAVFSDAVSRVADTTESILATGPRTPDRPSGS